MHHTDKRFFHLIKMPWLYKAGECAIRISYKPAWSEPEIWPQDVVDTALKLRKHCVARKWPPDASEEDAGDVGQELYKWGGQMEQAGTGARGEAYKLTIEILHSDYLGDRVESGEGFQVIDVAGNGEHPEGQVVPLDNSQTS